MAAALRMNAFENNGTANFSGLKWQLYSTTLGEGDTFQDLFYPSWWVHYSTGGRPALILKDMVNAIAHDGSFDVFLRVIDVIPGGIIMDLHSGKVPYEYKDWHADDFRKNFTKNEADFAVCEMDRNGKAIPRIEHLPATDWRVIGNKGDVIAQNIRSKNEADNQLVKYMYELQIRFPSAAEMAAHVTARELKEIEQTKISNRRSAKAA